MTARYRRSSDRAEERERARAAAPSGDGGYGGIDPSPYYTGPMAPADPTERGFKDTVKANHGQVTIIRAKFDLPAGVTAPQKYVHHCHIVEHEDNDMMRPVRRHPVSLVRARERLLHRFGRKIST